MLYPLAARFVTTLAISILLKFANTNSFVEAFHIGLIAGIGFTMAIVFTAAVILPIMKKPLMFRTITGMTQALGVIIIT